MPKALAGDSNAQGNIGLMYIQGLGVKKNYSKAIKWFKKSAAQDNSFAQLNLGVTYVAGYGVHINDRLAYKWFLKSAENGNETAKKYIVKLLYENKTNPIAITGNNDSSLRVALDQGDKKLVALLIKKGVVLNKDDESVLSKYIQLMGPFPTSYSIKDILPSYDAPGGSFTLSPTDYSDLLEIKMEKKGDFIRTNNGNQIIDGDNTLIRFKGKVNYKGYLFNGSVSNPATFYLTKKYGLTYLKGEGTVFLKTGEKITFSNGSVQGNKTSTIKHKHTKDIRAGNLTVPLPANGHVFYKKSGQLIAPLEVTTKHQKYHYYVKVSDINNNKVVQTLFLRSGGIVKTKLPLGSYVLKYATGETWYGEEKLFGKDTQYNKAEKVFNFSRKNDRISGYRIELILQKDGNLSTRKITKSEW